MLRSTNYPVCSKGSLSNNQVTTSELNDISTVVFSWPFALSRLLELIEKINHKTMFHKWLKQGTFSIKRQATPGFSQKAYNFYQNHKTVQWRHLIKS